MSEPVAPSALQVLRRRMHEKWAQHDVEGAAAIARLILPHEQRRHPRAAADPDAPIELHRLTDAELREQIAELRVRVAAERAASS